MYPYLFGIPSTIQANISYRTHAIGLALGVISAIVYFRRNREVIREAEVLEWEGPPDESDQVLRY